jgi:hypothetical protein
LPFRQAVRRRVSMFWLVVPAIAMVSLAIAGARAETATVKIEEVDTEHMFGFTEGSEIGSKGETELLNESTGHFGKGSGSYRQLATTFEVKHTLTDRFRVSGAATVAYYGISTVSGLDDRQQAVLQSASFTARYRALDHSQAPFALTFSVETFRGFVDDTSGARADNVGAVFAALADRELVPDRLFAAFNLTYEIERTRLFGNSDVTRESTFGVSAALAGRTVNGLFVGAEVRYLRRYDGLPLSDFAGQAVYVGPTVYARLGEQALISAAWNVQVWGAQAHGFGGLELTHFDRHQALLRLGVQF